SPLQLEILIQSTGVQYTIGYAAAVGAICVLGAAIDPKARFEPRFWSAIIFAILSTACLAIGLLVWPILIIEAWLCDARRKHHLRILMPLTVLLFSAYAWAYSWPA